MAGLVKDAAGDATAAATARGEEWPDTAGWTAGVRAWVWGRLGGNSRAWATHCKTLLTTAGELPAPTWKKLPEKLQHNSAPGWEAVDGALLPVRYLREGLRKKEAAGAPARHQMGKIIATSLRHRSNAIAFQLNELSNWGVDPAPVNFGVHNRNTIVL